jgi:glycine oxidase
MMKKNHFLIVGAGLSGCCIAVHLLQEGQRVTVIDNQKNTSSKVAAGIVNPIVFRRMTKSWRVDEMLPYSNAFYSELSEKTGVRLHVPITLRRMFSSEQERDFWLTKEKRADFSPYLNPVTTEDMNFDGAINTFGSGRLNQTFYVLTDSFLNTVHQFITMSENGTFIKTDLDYTTIDPDLGIYNETSYDGIIFCEGVSVKENPWFNYIPVNPTKGEILTIHTTAIQEDELLNRKCFLLPIGNNTFKVGSTYVWDTLDNTPTNSGKQEIESNLRYVTDKNYTIINQESGIRPTTRDRRPIIGTHKAFNKLHVFNGLGAKGYLLAPLLAKEFVKHLLTGAPLDPEVVINRIKD